jgi:hypothetical protein
MRQDFEAKYGKNPDAASGQVLVGMKGGKPVYGYADDTYGNGYTTVPQAEQRAIFKQMDDTQRNTRGAYTYSPSQKALAAVESAFTTAYDIKPKAATPAPVATTQTVAPVAAMPAPVAATPTPVVATTPLSKYTATPSSIPSPMQVSTPLPAISPLAQNYVLSQKKKQRQNAFGTSPLFSPLFGGSTTSFYK